MIGPGCTTAPPSDGAATAICEATGPLRAAHARALAESPCDGPLPTGRDLIAALDAGCEGVVSD